MSKFHRLIIASYEMPLLTIVPLAKALCQLAGGPGRTLVGYDVLARRLSAIRRVIVCRVPVHVLGLTNSISMAGA